ncbi:MAG: diaminopimelate epimerase [Arenicellales bacterium WSBS_2016_MAG_OTU3]
MRLEFTKMQSVGNDFIVIDGINQLFEPSADLARKLADRHTGIGCDQILLAQLPAKKACKDSPEFKFRIFNADGGEVAQCGNGARCFARFLRDKKLTRKNSISVETANGQMTLLDSGDEVKVEIAVPEFTPEKIPFQANAQQDKYAISVGGASIQIAALAVGNPHAVQRVANVDSAEIETLGPLIEQHPRFPERVNAGFMQVVNKQHIKLRVHERGVGETLACGSGATAAAVTGILWGLLDEHVIVSLPGGKVSVSWAGLGQPAFLSGPAETVFEGQIDLDTL